MSSRLLFWFCFLSWGINSFGQNTQNVFDLNKKLGRGINMGNMFEAPTETAWGNPYREDYFHLIAKLGFQHVRVPIRWDTPARTLQNAPYTIDTQFLNRIKSVIDKALAENLYVVINMHHHDELFADPDKVKPRFLSQWAQIATFFKNYDSRLLFEVMNEPNSKLTPEKWNVFFADALTEIRKTNPTRAVLVGTANWGGLGGLPFLKLPKDPNLILTIHYYDPFQFTHQGAEWVEGANQWLGTKWENTNLERDEIAEQFAYLKTFTQQNNLPVHIGEFGAYSKADLDSRVKWSNFVARWFEQQGYSWAYWEFSAGFGIFNPVTNQYLQPLVDALLKNPMSEPIVVNTLTIFESRFDASDNAWQLNVQPQAQATFSRSNGTGVIDIRQISTEGWHVQLVRNDITLRKGRRYLVSFEGRANADTPLTHYLGRAAAPWNAYSGYKGFTLTPDFQRFSYSFVMSDADDPKARIVFDLGSKVAQISLKNFVIKEVTPNDLFPLAVCCSNKREVKVFPNPTTDELQLEGIKNYQKVSIFNLKGQELTSVDLNGENSKILSLKHLSQGQYLLILTSEQERISFKFSKQE
ncbi:MAG: cellulase family glycosylhydrolase [Runella sp.]